MHQWLQLQFLVLLMMDVLIFIVYPYIYCISLYLLYILISYILIFIVYPYIRFSNLKFVKGIKSILGAFAKL
jgi:hypothetical protein